MQYLKSIGSISDLIDTRKDKKRKSSLSEELREERERLFGGVKRKRKSFLPSSKKNRSAGTAKVSEEILLNTSEIVLSKIHERINTPICPANAYRSVEMRGTEDYLERMHPTNRAYLRKEIVSIRIMACYILYHCYNFNQQYIADFFGIHRDFTGAANQNLGARFANNEEEEEAFRDIFDYFMQINRREYA